MLCKVINSKCLNGLLRLLDDGSFADLLAAGLLNGVVVDLCLLFTICKSNYVFVSSKDIFLKSDFYKLLYFLKFATNVSSHHNYR